MEFIINYALSQLKNTEWYAGVEFFLSKQVTTKQYPIEFKIGRLNMQGALDGFQGKKVEKNSLSYLKGYTLGYILRQEVKVHCCSCPSRTTEASNFASHAKISPCSLFDRERSIS